MATTPRVTVSIPTFNRASFLLESGRSVLAQTFGELELAILDNASEDDTPAVAAELSADPRVTYRRHDHNIGMVGNQNAAYYGGSGDYVLVIGDDDLTDPRQLERLVAVLDAEPRVAVVHSSFNVIDAAGAYHGTTNWTGSLAADTVEDGQTFLRQSMAHGCRICASTALVRRSALPPGGMHEEDRPAVDLLFWLRIARDGWQFAYLSEPLASYRVHPSSFSATEYAAEVGDSYRYRTDAIDALHALKVRFLSEQPVPAEVSELERLAGVGRRRALVWLARSASLERRGSRLRRLRFLREVARLDPGAFLSSLVWRPLAADVLRTLFRVRR